MNSRQNQVEFTHHLIVPETQHPIAFRIQKCRPDSVRLYGVGMLRTINLDDQLSSMGGEVRKILSEGYLAAETRVREMATQRGPEL